jgi:cell division protein FtsB
MKLERILKYLLIFLLSLLSVNSQFAIISASYIRSLKKDIRRSKIDQLNKKLEQENSNIRIIDRDL